MTPWIYYSNMGEWGGGPQDVLTTDLQPRGVVRGGHGIEVLCGRWKTRQLNCPVVGIAKESESVTDRKKRRACQSLLRKLRLTAQYRRDAHLDLSGSYTLTRASAISQYPFPIVRYCMHALSPGQNRAVIEHIQSRDPLRAYAPDTFSLIYASRLQLASSAYTQSLHPDKQAPHLVEP